jgi:nucleoside phosphorylase
MSLVFLFAATKMESSIVERMMRAKTHPRNAKSTTAGEIGHHQIVLVNTGMGPNNARASAMRVFQPSCSSPGELRNMFPIPDAAIITGLAGSLVPWIAEGDIVVYKDCLSANGEQDPIHCSPQIVASINGSLGVHGLKSTEVTGISSRRIAHHDQERGRLAEAGAAVVDMESYEVAACAAAAGVPVAVLRAVSDSPGSRMPDLNRALNPAGEFNRWALASVLAARPLATASLFKASRRAIAALERALNAVLSKGSLLGGLAEAQAAKRS